GRGCEATHEQIWGWCCALMMFDRDALALHPLRLDPRLAQQPGDEMFSTSITPRVERAPDLHPSVGLPVLHVHATDVDQQPLVAQATGAGRAIEPSVKSAARKRELPTQPCHGKLVAMVTDETVLHGNSFAKYAAAFFKMS